MLFRSQRKRKLPGKQEVKLAEGIVSKILSPRYTLEHFIVGGSNRLAYAACQAVASAPGGKYNPLFLYGGVGLGKTHLMTAIAWHIRRRHPQRKVMYLSAEKFMFQFIRAMRSKDTMSFKEQFRSVDVLMIDDVQFIAGKDATQEELDRKSTRLNSSHVSESRMPSSA